MILKHYRTIGVDESRNNIYVIGMQNIIINLVLVFYFSTIEILKYSFSYN